MLAAVIGLTLLSIGAVTYVSHRARVRVLALEATVEALRSETSTSVDGLADNQRKLKARQDRLQRMVTDQGWRDSMLLTRFDWRKPTDRG